MNRRRFLGAAAGAVGLVSLSTGAYAVAALQDDEEEEDDAAVLDIVDYELVVADDEGGDTYLAATVENVGAVASGWITLEADWYDEDGEYVDTDLAHLGTLRAEGIWLARVYYDGPEDVPVADFTLEGRADYEPLTAPEGLDVLDTEIEVDDGEVAVTGSVGNDTGEDRESTDVIALFSDDEGRLLGDAWTNLADLPDGERQSFEVAWDGRDRADDVADYRTIATSAAFGDAQDGIES